MLTRSRVLFPAAAALALLFASYGPALALPEALSKTEVGCQATINKALPAYGKARTACIASCEKKTPHSADCRAPFGGKTLECVQKALTKVATAITKKCTSSGNDDDSCPECFESISGTCDAFGTAMTAKATALTDDLTSTVLCDDSASPDGLTKAEAKCQKTLIAAMTKFVASATKCATNCLKNERKGKTDGSCNPAGFLNLAGDSKTVQCVAFKAFFKLSAATTKCEAPEGDAPECMPDTFTIFDHVKDALVDIGGNVNVCPTVCGDGYVQGVEACDPPGFAVQCPVTFTCSSQCTCL